MSAQKRTIFSILIFVSLDAGATNNDSIFINSVKSFIVARTGFRLDVTFYGYWSNSEKPYITLFMSKNDTIKSSEKYPYILFGIEEDRAKKRALRYEAQGHQTFIYKTYANAEAAINQRFISYSNESKCFIMLHESIHHYVRDLRLGIPYEFEEALGDVIGHYGAIEFFMMYDKSLVKNAKNQRLRNEKIYKAINKTTVR